MLVIISIIASIAIGTTLLYASIAMSEKVLVVNPL